MVQNKSTKMKTAIFYYGKSPKQKTPKNIFVTSPDPKSRYKNDTIKRAKFPDNKIGHDWHKQLQTIFWAA